MSLERLINSWRTMIGKKSIQSRLDIQENHTFKASNIRSLTEFLIQMKSWENGPSSYQMHVTIAKQKIQQNITLISAKVVKLSGIHWDVGYNQIEINLNLKECEKLFGIPNAINEDSKLINFVIRGQPFNYKGEVLGKAMAVIENIQKC